MNAHGTYGESLNDGGTVSRPRGGGLKRGGSIKNEHHTRSLTEGVRKNMPTNDQEGEHKGEEEERTAQHFDKLHPCGMRKGHWTISVKRKID